MYSLSLHASRDVFVAPEGVRYRLPLVPGLRIASHRKVQSSTFTQATTSTTNEMSDKSIHTSADPTFTKASKPQTDNVLTRAHIDDVNNKYDTASDDSCKEQAKIYLGPHSARLYSVGFYLPVLAWGEVPGLHKFLLL